MEDSQTGLGSSTTAKPEHSLPHPACWGQGGLRGGEGETSALCPLLAPPGLPSTALDREEPQLPKAPRTATLLHRGLLCLKALWELESRHPETDKFSSQGMWQAWVSSTPL